MAVDFEDPVFAYHVRILLIRLEGSQWIAASCDWEIEVLDLADHTVVPLARGAEPPQRVRGNIYMRTEVDEVARAAAHAEARALAVVVGSAVTGGASATSAEWYFSDTDHERVGETVPGDCVRNPAVMVMRGSSALVNLGEEDGWTHAERVLPADHSAWVDEKRNGPGRDPRVLPLQKDARGQRYCNLREALTNMTPLTEPPPKDWPFRGPSAALELLQSARAAGEDLTTFHAYFLQSSGLSAESQVAIKHRDLLAVLTHLVCFDQGNAPQLASAELVARLVLQIHQAVKRCPRAPYFRGTQVMVMSKLDSSGGLLTGDFARFVADEQKTEAFTMKQQRLFAEEEENKSPKKPGKGPGKGDA